jgi:hypothetical protein
MHRASADDSFTWRPFDHGRRRRMAAVVGVGLCSGLVGLAVGRVSSGVGPERPPAFKSAVPNNQTAVTTHVTPPVVRLHPDNEEQPTRIASGEGRSPLQRGRPDSLTQAPTVARKDDQSVPPSPPVVVLNPGTVSADAPALATTVPKKNDQGILPANEAPAIVQPPHEQTRTRRAHVSNEPGRSKEPRSFRPARPATFADYGALRDYMLGH